MTAVKVIRFLAGEPSLGDTLRSRWARALAGDAGATGAESSGRPIRAAVMTPLEVPGLPAPRFAAIDIQWFADARGALANDAWLAGVAPGLCRGSLPDHGDSCHLVAEEVVLRGHDYLDARWGGGGDRLKMMSFGRRNPRLTLAEFSARWRGQAGRLGGQSIPDEVRGLAYVQNHPVRLDGREWPLDAVNEVWFERLDHLRQRAAWFAERQQAALRTDAESFMSPTETWSMFVRESPV
jgi:EthD domain